MPRSTARALSQRELNRATLARQLLLERARLPVARAVERLCAMQAQSAKAPYAGLWSRLEGFRREQLTRAYERKRVVRSTLFRVTMQLVSAADHPSFAALMHARWRDEFANWKLPAEEWSRRIVRLAEDGPFTYAAANAAVPELPERYRWRVRCLTPLVHVPPAGTWGNHRIHVTTAERWLGASEVDTRAAAALLIERYLAGYGPASKADLQRFSGLRAGDVNAGFEELEPRLVQFEAEDGRTLFDLRRAKRPPADTPAPIRFLPEWDHLILGFDERSRVLPPDVAPAVIKKNGDVLPTFLVGRSRRRNLALRGRQGEDRAVRAASARRAAGARGRGPAPGSLSRVNPPTFDDVLAARERIAPHLRPTPLYRWPDSVRARRRRCLGQAREPPACRRFQGSRRRQPRLAALGGRAAARPHLGLHGKPRSVDRLRGQAVRRPGDDLRPRRREPAEGLGDRGSRRRDRDRGPRLRRGPRALRGPGPEARVPLRPLR